jgi:hypothetical protein
VIKTVGAQAGQFLLGCKCPEPGHCHVRTRPPSVTFLRRGVFPS